MKFLIGKKERMTQVFDAAGNVRPATLVTNAGLVVTQVRTKDKDGYEAVQLGYQKLKKPTKSRAAKPYTRLIEYRAAEAREGGEAPTPGTEVNVEAFAVGDIVTVSGVSKGKGFQGVVKRHGFSGGPRTHGQKHSEREPGAIGGGGGRAGGRVAKGIRMAGRMGGERITVKNLEVIGVNKEAGQILIAGAIPGRPGTLLEIRG